MLEPTNAICKCVLEPQGNNLVQPMVVKSTKLGTVELKVATSIGTSCRSKLDALALSRL